MNAIEVEAVVRSLGHRRVLDGVSLRAAPGELVALLGRNGAGKSTLLSILATLLRPSSGRASLWGACLERDADAARRLLGYLGHGSGLYDGMTVKENLWLAGRLRGVADIGARVDAALEVSALGPYRDRMVRHLSKGLARRAALERVLLHDPRVLLLDEPFEGLDPGAQEAFGARLRQMCAAGAAILMATHDVGGTRELCSRALVLSGGRVAHDVPAASLTVEMLR